MSVKRILYGKKMQLYESFIEKAKRLMAEAQGQKTISFDAVVSILGYSSHYILILFLTLPFLQPIPLPGLSSLFGMGICLSSLCIIASRRLYVPRSLRSHMFSAKKVEKMTERLMRFSTKIEKWLHPRGRFMAKHTLLRKINGSLLFAGGLLLALPLPIPFSNTLPAYGIAILCLGSLKEDGLFVSIGWALFGIALIYVLLLTKYSLHLLGAIP